MSSLQWLSVKGLRRLQSSSDWAQKLYDDEYVAPAPPPSPMVTAYPADGQVSLIWDSAGRWVDNGVDKSIEEYVDVTDPEKIFEGYRVYRRDTAYDEKHW